MRWGGGAEIRTIGGSGLEGSGEGGGGRGGRGWGNRRMSGADTKSFPFHNTKNNNFNYSMQIKDKMYKYTLVVLETDNCLQTIF